MLLLRPYFLSYKNRILAKIRTGRILNREVLIIILAALVMFGFFIGFCAFFAKIKVYQEVADAICIRIIGYSLLAVFGLLILSNLVTALGYFYAANDLPLILSLPISRFRLYMTRLTETMLSSSWMAFLFIIPFSLSLIWSFHLPWSIFSYALVSGVCLAIIASSIAAIIVTLFVNIFPAHRMKELLVIIVFICVCFLSFQGQEFPGNFSLNEEQLGDILSELIHSQDPSPAWLPTHWATNILSSYFSEQVINRHLNLLVLILVSLASLGLGFIVFKTLFTRGWSLCIGSGKVQHIGGVMAGVKLARLMIPFPSQLRAMFYKETRCFIRDTSQSLHLILLLMLSLVYLYNFRALRNISNISVETALWWKTILAISNIALASCIIAAISTRFVFPSVSFEGRAYQIIRSAPLALHKLLYYKYFVWLFPVGGITTTLLVSGSWAIQLPPNTVLLSGLIAIAMSIGLVGLGIGIGAVFARFDWSSPSQLAASFGSLFFMVLALGLIFISLLPAGFLLVLSCVPNVAAKLSGMDRLIAVSCSFFLLFYANLTAARHALKAGEETLRSLER